MLKVIGIDDQRTGCSYHRIRLPFQYAGHYLASNSGDTLEERCQQTDLVVYSRDFPVGSVANLKKLKGKYGFKVCLDLDDYWEVYKGHYLEELWKKTGTAKIIRENMRMADVITVTTERLANEVRKFHSNVHVIPNALPYGHGQFAKPAGINPRKSFNFIYAGQKSHLHDIKQVKNALLSLAKDYTNAGFILAGYSDSPDGIWRNIEKEFTSHGKLPNYQRIENRPLEHYMSVYRHADAVVVPLVPNEFNSYKSNLKILEAGVYGLPVVCQNTPPYSDCTAPALFADDTPSWRHHMQQLVNDSFYAMQKGMEISNWCRKNHHLITVNEKRFTLYKNVINENN